MTGAETENATIEFDGCRAVKKLQGGPVTDLYRAEQETLGRPVLIKALSPSVLPTSPFAATLEREARLLSGLEHENIVRLYDFVRRDDTMWLVLELVEGYTLAEVLEKCERMPPRAAAIVTLQLGRALRHAHAHDIVHRDVQPKNILISREGRVKLMNFSVATDHRMPTAPELLEGDSGFVSPSYMSPEQVLGEPPDARSDLFSLGMILFEMLTKHRPFDAPDSRATTQRIRHDPPPPLSRFHVRAPPAIERIVQRCLQKMPSDRFGSADELVGALEELLGNAAHAPEGPLADELARAGLPMEVAPPSTPPAASWSPRPEPRSFGLGTVFVGYAIAFTVLVGGLGVIQYAGRKSDESHSRGTTRLELVPARSAYLRVVADPWADVIVDGQKVATTPFAEPIPLSAGTHYVRLEHPDAPVERRTVRLAPGEMVLLDVEMEVNRPRPKEKPPPLPSASAAPRTP